MIIRNFSETFLIHFNFTLTKRKYAYSFKISLEIFKRKERKGKKQKTKNGGLGESKKGKGLRWTKLCQQDIFHKNKTRCKGGLVGGRKGYIQTDALCQ